MSVCLGFLVCEMAMLVPIKIKGCVGESYCRGHPMAEAGAEQPFPCDIVLCGCRSILGEPVPQVHM